jgi:hypothetical protein
LTNISWGTHTIGIKDAKNCTRSYSVSYSNPNQILIVQKFLKNSTCFGGSDGAIKVVGSNTFAPYSYHWNNGMSGDSIFGLKANTYLVTVSDSKNCSNTWTVNLTEPPQIIINSSVNNLKCYRDGTGSIAINVTGGVPGFIYNWSNGGKKDSIAGLQVGSYSVTVTDSKNCPMIGIYNVTEPSPISFNLTGTKSACLESQNGVASIINLNGGTTPYSFSWSNGVLGQLIISNLKPLNYYKVTVTDKNNCTRKDSIFIDTSYRLKVKITGVLSKCPDIPSSMNLIPINGTSPYQYSINGNITPDGVYPNVQNTILAIYVVDAFNCPYRDTQDLTIKDSMRPVLVNHVPSCTDASMFGSKLIVSGGHPPFIFDWPGAIKIYGDSAVHIKGSYHVTVKDQFCSKTLYFFLDPPDGLLQSIVIKKQNVSCFGGHDGRLQLKTFGGKKPYFFNWSDGQTDSVGVNLIANLSYQVTVSDINGCIFKLMDSVKQPDLIQTKISPKNPSCPDKKDGLVMLQSIGGAPSVFGYQYALDSSLYTSNNIFWGLTGRKYFVMTKDSNQCVIKDSIELIAPARLSVLLPSLYEISFGNDLTIEPQVLDSNNVYKGSMSFLWSPSTGINCVDCKNTVFNGYVPQHYTLYVTYGKGCVDSAKTYIKINPLDEEIYIPSAFNPKSENEENRKFYVFGNKIIGLRMSIYNRWGEKVFQSETMDSFWDGYYKGEQAQPGIYTYELEVQLLNTKRITRMGSFTKF